MNPSIKRLSCVLLAVLWLPIQGTKPIIQTGDINLNLPKTIIIGSNNTVVVGHEDRFQ
jgi:hypothetical protein